MSDLGHARTSLVARLGGATLALAVAGIHIADQGGFPGSMETPYVLVLFYVLEAVAVATAIAFLLPLGPRLTAAAWTTAATVVAAGPLIGYSLSRGPGLPGYDEDRGNWTEPLGVASLVVEAALLIVSVMIVVTIRRSRRRREQPIDHRLSPSKSQLADRL